MRITSEKEMLECGESFAKKLNLDTPVVIELVGDVGAGKTTFTRGLFKALGVKEPVTSPSFTISKTYVGDGGVNLVHYDFYRLGDPGLMAEDLEESINTPKTVTVVEWADTIEDVLPEERFKVKICYNDDDTREVTIE